MSRSKLLGIAVAALLILGLNASAAAAQSAAPNAPKSADKPMPGGKLAATDEERIAELVVANHILAYQNVLDGFGHISVRSASNPKHFYMARSRAPALVTRADILEFDENSKPVKANGPQPYGERFIHGEIYRARPDVYSVVHSHTPEVLPFTITKVPLKAVIHVGGFLGDEAAPVFEIRDSEGPENLMLVHDNKTGADLARALGKRPVVLMRGHGMAVSAPSIQDVVLRAIYTKMNAHVEAEALKLGEPVFMNKFESTRVDPPERTWELWVKQAEGSGSPQ